MKWKKVGGSVSLFLFFLFFWSSKPGFALWYYLCTDSKTHGFVSGAKATRGLKNLELSLFSAVTRDPLDVKEVAICHYIKQLNLESEEAAAKRPKLSSFSLFSYPLSCIVRQVLINSIVLLISIAFQLVFFYFYGGATAFESPSSIRRIGNLGQTKSAMRPTRRSSQRASFYEQRLGFHHA
ncbi:hypothetical protein H6P81_015067 [Aristolochia fimbriata]|uniref:Uncharacterized protein n=1 Tax=Aristolochia fimbriata TaxID=158543 RepID=A0AAV7E899_ARIFI|nr:hypothetical protein H6P81_015067 [Aristolochia fimbriata]